MAMALNLAAEHLEVEGNERNTGNASTAVTAERIPLAQLDT
jgi:hypothetical protein